MLLSLAMLLPSLLLPPPLLLLARPASQTVKLIQARSRCPAFAPS
jgi:hypothetical protein